MGCVTTSLYSYDWTIRIKGEIQLEIMKPFLLFLLLLTLTYSQHYSISVWGFNTTDVVQTKNDSGSIEFNAQNRGFFDVIWPTKNHYKTIFDKKNFSIKSYNKKIRQGAYQTSLICVKNSDQSLTYNKKKKIKTYESTYNIFSMLAMVQSKKKDSIDTEWFNYEHEGQLGLARFLWSDTVNIWDGKDSILCDHYRFDIKITDSTQSLNNNDYFMKNITNNNAVKELWVSCTKPKKIIAAKIKLGGFNLKAIIQSEKEF